MQSKANKAWREVLVNIQTCGTHHTQIQQELNCKKSGYNQNKGSTRKAKAQSNECSWSSAENAENAMNALAVITPGGTRK